MKPPNLISKDLPAVVQPVFRPARYKVLYGGRGSAKSTSIAVYLVLECMQRQCRILCTREIQKSLSASVHQLIVDVINNLGLERYFRVTKVGIAGPHGSLFLFAGLRTNPESIKSMEGLTHCWVEEADRTGQSSLDLLTPTMRRPGSEILFSFNRRNPTDPVDAMFLGGEAPPNSVVTEMNWRDNPFFPKVLWDEMMWLKRRDRDKWLHIWEGQPLVRSEARVFNNWVEDDIDDLIPEGTLLRYGADWGFSVDPTVLIGCYVWDRTLYVRHEAWKLKCHIDETPAFFAGSDTTGNERWKNPYKPGAEKHKGLPDANRARITADSARPETIAYLRARGFDIHSAVKGPGSVQDGVEFLQSYDIVVHPSCKHTLDELTMYSYKVDKLTDAVTNELEDKKNHVIDSLRYALENVRRNARDNAAGLGPGGLQGRVIQG